MHTDYLHLLSCIKKFCFYTYIHIIHFPFVSSLDTIPRYACLQSTALLNMFILWKHAHLHLQLFISYTLFIHLLLNLFILDQTFLFKLFVFIYSSYVYSTLQYVLTMPFKSNLLPVLFSSINVVISILLCNLICTICITYGISKIIELTNLYFLFSALYSYPDKRLRILTLSLLCWGLIL